MKIWYEKGAWISKKARRFVDQTTPESVKFIAVIRHAALGDMVITRPFLIELRRFFPNARITLSLVSNYVYGAPEDLVDAIHIVSRKGGSISQRIKEYKALGEQDIIFDLAATTRSFWITLFNKAKLKVGFPYHMAQQWMYYDIAILRSDMQPEAEVMLHTLNILGCATHYPLIYDLPGKSMPRERPFLLYFTGASVASKCWAEDNFLQLIDKAATALPQFDHIILCGHRPEESVEHLVDKLKHHANVIGTQKMSLDECTGLIKAAALVVTNDNGVRNVAIAAETATVGIFFATVPFRYWPREGNNAAVFNADGSIPSVTQVLDAVLAMVGNPKVVRVPSKLW
ncbi:MAG: glycosyltransferase family 9 protein [Gammaproteobacteria bacterium]|nr:glycosyltransferase family 9 protein [Gammaproteobacteria bacterium]